MAVCWCIACWNKAEIAEQILQFRNGDRCTVRLHIPGVHSASCLWLLEHPDRVNPGILQGRLRFNTRTLQLQLGSGAVTAGRLRLHRLQFRFR